MFLDKKTLLKIWLNPGLNLTIFRGTWPWGLKLKKTLTLLHFGCVYLHYCCCTVYSIYHSNWHALWHGEPALWSPTIRDFNHMHCWVWHLYHRVWNNQCPYRYFKFLNNWRTLCPLADSFPFLRGIVAWSPSDTTQSLDSLSWTLLVLNVAGF